MRCAGCASTLEAKARDFPHVAQASVNFPARRLRLEPGDDAFSRDDFVAAMGRIGYGLAPPRRRGADQAPEAWVPPLGLLALLGGPVLLAEHGLMALPAAGVLVPLLATAVQILGGAEFYRGARAAWRAGAGTMDLLVAVGITAAYGFSMLTLLVPGLTAGPAHFAGSVMLILFIRLGRSLEERMRARTRSALDMLAARELGEAVLLRDDGSERVIPADGLRVGDRCRVRAGERLPADGLVLEGESEAEEAFLTGEPLPRPKAPGDHVLATSLNGSGALVLRVERVGADSLYERVLALAEASLAEKPPVQRFADGAAAVFVPVVLGLAALTLLVWLGLTQDPARALTAATAVVVVACPCALGLATPTAIMVASGAAAESGFLFRSGGALEAMAGLTRIAFDKTGTLTQGRFSLVAVHPAPGETEAAVRALAQGLEAHSSHPLAAALRGPEGSPVEAAAGAREVPGRGVEAGALRLGSARWMLESGIDAAALDELAGGPGEATVLYLAEGDRLRAAFCLDDTPRPEAAALLRDLSAAGLRPVLLSGDRAPRVQALARALGIEGRGELLPEEKLAWIEARQAEGERVGYVGDGVNDAPALARADLGVALGSGSARARESGDLVLLSGDLSSLGRALVLARRTMAVIRQNLVWAVGYNLLGLPLAAGVLYPWTGTLLPPHWAGLAMALSSVSVVGNSLRLAGPVGAEGAP